jgi:hypothetical protein
MDERQQLLETAVFGRQVQEFTGSPIGKYLIQCADEEIEAGIAAVMAADADDVASVRRAQNRAWIGRKFKSWLLEAVNAGLQAESVLDDREPSQSLTEEE